MDELLFYIIVMITSIIIHEAGHYAGFRIYHIKPRLKLRFSAITIGENEMYALNSKQAVIVGLAGILPGLVVITATHSFNIMLIYLLACCYDITVISMYMSSWKNPTPIYKVDLERLTRLDEALKK